ncbi:hypothetical protein AciX8_0009 [Granulicella mallensis MP5ACTX8]|uniref:Uncharacterized protein n=2 Tax=Granulicella mallensis TaxID=940614 RepID=G8NWT2_GRAMM|nr:hypothetical protein AciX8_0009 [Granulicella mallensis MP5ACTX8]
MNPVADETSVWIPRTEEDKEKVRQQMNRLLETSHFKNSRRYPLLFRFIVEETLEGRGEFLKERLLGVRVFERPADYDTASDPIVRVTIAEIRKRIAQYYHEEAHESEMRIELMPGRYEPEFRPRKEAGSDQHSIARVAAFLTDIQAAENAASESQAAAVATARSGRKRLVLYVVGVVAVLLVALGAGFFWRGMHPSALDAFWGPLLANRRTVVFCLPMEVEKSGSQTAAAAGILVQDPAATPNHPNPPVAPVSDTPLTSSFLAHETLGENIVFSDALATLRISNFLAAHNRESNYRLNTTTTLDDLRQGPVVLIGGLDNQWTLRAIAPLRYRFSGTYQEEYWISDAKNPEMKDWGLDLKIRLADAKRDFAIVARIHDESTGQVEVIVAGIGMSGTAAAGEFLVDPRQMEELRRRIGPGFQDHDFEAVLKMDVVNGIAGSPKILTVAVW